MLKDEKVYDLTLSEEAVKLHLEMWGDMQKELGDTPSSKARLNYKRHWLIRKGYEGVLNNCFLCEFAFRQGFKIKEQRGRISISFCKNCPIDWSSLSRGLCDNQCYDFYINGSREIYLCAPISEILALPVKG